MSNINKIRLSGTTYNLQDSNATKTVELTQAQYDALAVKDPNTFYIISDGQGADLSDYTTTATTDALNTVVTAHTANTTIHVTSSEKATWNAKSDFSGDYNDLTNKPTIPTDYATTGDVQTAVASKQDTLVSGTNIKTINNESILGSGNITIQGGGGSTYTAGDGISIVNDVISVSGKVDTSAVTTSVTSASTDSEIPTAKAVYDAMPSGGGGKAVSAGTNISITTGETADTVNCTLPISSRNNTCLTIFANSDIISNNSSINLGYSNSFGTYPVRIFNFGCFNHFPTYGNQYFINFGDNNNLNGNGWNYTFGSNLKTSSYYETAFGKYNTSNGWLFSIGNGNSDSQRHNALEITKDGDIYIANTDDTTSSNFYEKPMVRLQDTISALGGLKLVKLTQSEYDALTTKDNSTLYVIVN